MSSDLPLVFNLNKDNNFKQTLQPVLPFVGFSRVRFLSNFALLLRTNITHYGVFTDLTVPNPVPTNIGGLVSTTSPITYEIDKDNTLSQITLELVQLPLDQGSLDISYTVVVLLLN